MPNAIGGWWRPCSYEHNPKVYHVFCSLIFYFFSLHRFKLHSTTPSVIATAMPDRVISLTSLPNEVLAQISEELLPGDIWSLASTNRLLRLLVEPHLFQYQASFNHSTLTLRECGKTASKTVVKTSSVITYLARISNDPQFAQYPLSIVTSNPEGKEYEMTLGNNDNQITTHL